MYKVYGFDLYPCNIDPRYIEESVHIEVGGKIGRVPRVARILQLNNGSLQGRLVTWWFKEYFRVIYVTFKGHLDFSLKSMLIDTSKGRMSIREMFYKRPFSIISDFS